MATSAATRADWTSARVALLAREKEATRALDALAEARRTLPRVRVDAPYSFNSERGEETLANLFDGRGQLIVYHFMFDPGWHEGCTSCSFWADGMNGVDVHLVHRDTTLVMASRAPFPTLDAYRRRMGWTLRWVSSGGCDFNRDFGVHFPERTDTELTYNFRPGGFPIEDAPGVSAFARDPDGTVWHTYSAYGRGLDIFNGAYQLLDFTAKGRDEAGLNSTMAWLRRRDAYPD